MKTIDSLISELQGLSNDAYVRYIQQLRQDECLGADYKMEKGKFNSDNLKAHCTALQWLGKHRAYEESISLLRKIVEEYSWQPSETCPVDGTVVAVSLHDYNRCFYGDNTWWYYCSDEQDSYAAGSKPNKWKPA